MRVTKRISLIVENLEQRHLLAGDFLPGDANKDYYLDEADVIQVDKFGKVNTGEQATWEQGDYNGDGIVDKVDFDAAFEAIFEVTEREEGSIIFGRYDEDAGEPVDQLQSIATDGTADLQLFYFPLTGTVTAVPTEGMKIHALHLVSKSRSFIGKRGPFFYDFATSEEQFVRTNYGNSWIENIGLLPLGWTEQQVIDDLMIDGAMYGGGDLGNVRLVNPDTFPRIRPEDALRVPKDLPTFASRDEANAVLTYDPETGDILIESLGAEIAGVELVSPAGFFTGTIGANDRYAKHIGVTATPTRFFRSVLSAVVSDDGIVNFITLPGFETVNLPGIAQIGLTQANFSTGVHPTGSFVTGTHMKLALEIGPTFGECRENLENGAIVGDANLDGQFNSQDLVTIFQAGEYADGEPDNSTWSEGDWTCDGDFDTDDLVAAFQTGAYESPAAALAIGRIDDQRVVSRSQPIVSSDVANVLENQFVARRKVLKPATSLNDFRVRHSSTKDSSQIAWSMAWDEVMSDLEFVAWVSKS